jgi:hypothetical protein
MLKWVSHLPGFSALTSDAGEEECFSELVPLLPEGLGACETGFLTAQGRDKKLVREEPKPVGSGRFRDQTRDAEAVPGLVLALLIQHLPTPVSLLCTEVNFRHPWLRRGNVIFPILDDSRNSSFCSPTPNKRERITLSDFLLLLFSPRCTASC